MRARSGAPRGRAAHGRVAANRNRKRGARFVKTESTESIVRALKRQLAQPNRRHFVSSAATYRPIIRYRGHTRRASTAVPPRNESTVAATVKSRAEAAPTWKQRASVFVPCTPPSSSNVTACFPAAEAYETLLEALRRGPRRAWSPAKTAAGRVMVIPESPVKSKRPRRRGSSSEL